MEKGRRGKRKKKVKVTGPPAETEQTAAAIVEKEGNIIIDIGLDKISNTVNGIYDKPWIILRDFNQSLDPVDASSGGSRVTRGMEEFCDCLLSSNISDLPFRGNHYTWWNNQESNHIAKKIDKILVNDG